MLSIHICEYMKLLIVYHQYRDGLENIYLADNLVILSNMNLGKTYLGRKALYDKET